MQVIIPLDWNLFNPKYADHFLREEFIARGLADFERGENEKRNR